MNEYLDEESRNSSFPKNGEVENKFSCLKSSQIRFQLCIRTSHTCIYMLDIFYIF